MAQSLCKIYLHIIFHTKNTSPVLAHEHVPRMHQYIGNIVKMTRCHVICVGGIENHIHALILLIRTENVAHLVEEMKRNSSRWIKTISDSYANFAWQRGYAAFSVSQSQVETVISYIKNQEEHHKKQTFQNEYINFLKLCDIKYDERYVLSD